LVHRPAYQVVLNYVFVNFGLAERGNPPKEETTFSER
jgi:hypothetical protein